MALLTCSECGKEYSDQAKTCIHCGARNPGSVGGGEKFLTVAFWGAAGLFVVIGGLVWIGSRIDPQQTSDRMAIEECRKSENDELLTVDARRLARKVCDQMEADYAARWGGSP